MGRRSRSGQDVAAGADPGALQDENARLHELVLKLNALVARHATQGAAEPSIFADYANARPDLVEIAEECSRLSRQVREIVQGLEHIGDVLMAKAVAIETLLQQAKWQPK